MNLLFKNMLPIFILLNSCHLSYSEFVITIHSKNINSESILICGKLIPLNLSGNGVVGRRFSIKCEGSVSINLIMKNGNNTNCKIGYITPGMDKIHYYFSINGNDRNSRDTILNSSLPHMPMIPYPGWRGSSMILEVRQMM